MQNNTSILSELSLGVVICNSKGNVKFVNESFLKMFGVEKDILMNVSLFKDPNLPSKYKEELKEGNEVQLDFEYDFTLCNLKFFPTSNAGSKKFFSINIKPFINKTGKQSGYILTCNDCTKQKNQENELNRVHKEIENTNNNLMLALKAGKMQAFGYDVEERYYFNIGEKDEFKISPEVLCNKMHPDYRQKFLKLIDDILERDKEGEMIVEDEALIFKAIKDTPGVYDTLQLRYSLSKDSNNNVKKITFVVRSITRELNYREELIAAKKRAEESDNLKSAFLANMSHEIRTPLNAIVGFSNLLVETKNQKDKEVFSDIINSNNELLLHLIGDILDLSKIESNSIIFNIEKFDLKKLFEEINATMSLRMGNTDDVKIIMDIPYNSCMVKTDKNRLRQVINNYFTNAIKFTHQGYIKFGYKIEERGIKVFVEDTGIGIADTDRNKIFNRFQKVNMFAQGSGLGLAISKAVVEKQGGEVGYESQRGEGSTFWAFIPCPNIEVVELDAPIFKKNDLVNSKDQDLNIKKQKLNILVAEDNDSNYLLLSYILRQHNVVRAVNGKECVELALKRDIDIIFMDIRMPVMDGLEATKQIRDFNFNIKIAALTANAFDSDKTLAMKAGCDFFLTKPLNSKKVLELIEHI